MICCLRPSVFVCTVGLIASHLFAAESIRVACVGDSITAGPLGEAQKDSYPAQLQRLLGERFEVTNFGLGSATLLKTGRPNVWRKLPAIKEFLPNVVVISLGTNDTVGGKRKNWEKIDRFDADFEKLICSLSQLPSKPRIVLCTPTPMVLSTPGMSDKRLANLKERKPRLQQLCKQIRQLAEKHKDSNVSLLELNEVLAGRPELISRGDGVHPNPDGYAAIAKAVAERIRGGGVPADSK